MDEENNNKANRKISSFDEYQAIYFTKPVEKEKERSIGLSLAVATVKNIFNDPIEKDEPKR